QPRSFAATMLPQEAMDYELQRIWSPVNHLHSVADTEALRSAHAEAEQLLSEYSAEMGQNRDLFAAVKSASVNADFGSLPLAARTLVDHTLRDFKLSGVSLEEPARSRFRDIANELTRLTTEFENAVLDATDAWSESVDESALAGIPDSERGMFRDADGFKLTLKQPCVTAVLTYADDRSVRERVYRAYQTRASDQGPHAGQFDNSARMAQILALRHEAATLLGFANSAEESLATKMASTPDRVLDFLRDLVKRAKPIAERELTELRDFAREHLQSNDLQPWDVAYAAEKLRARKYDLSEEELKPYFALPAVIDGLFAIVNRVFGVVLQLRKDVDTWHPDVRFYDVIDESGRAIAGVYVDLYTRTGKRGGAWMDVCRSRFRNADTIHLPIAYITCNFAPPSGDQPALLTHDEVTTLFHEFGHGLHHLLTEVDYPGVAGIDGVEWDAVELPSQFMENFAWQRDALNLFARHWKTGELLPDDLFKRMLAARHYHAGLFLVRQLEFGLFDFRLHLEFNAEQGARVMDLLNEVRDEVAVIFPPAWQRMPHSFAHIFSGGYAAGYYSYLWAELLSADAFAQFEELGVFNRDSGAAFRRNVLAVGGSRPALESFVAFRGREPQIDALLRSYGLAA
ncbi:MAG TPA: M3 family metallopeptidase, partial [Rudaea sp.]|nr:M3 family metallopeptidase [Rudaea sp.]